MPEARRILIVDDEESMRLLLRRTLESIPSVEIALASGHEEALPLAAANAYHLILLDLLMPGVDGIEVLSRIRKSPLNKATPVIIVSVMADPDTRMVCQSLGVSDYVVKPVDREALRRTVSARLGAAG